MSSYDRPPTEATALVPVSGPEYRVRRAKQQLVQHATELEFRTRLLVRRSAWVAGAVVIGLASVVATASLLRAAARARHGRGDLATPAFSGIGSALLLAAAGALNRRLHRWSAAPLSRHYASSFQHPHERSPSS